MDEIKLAVMDMSGTTVNDHQELTTCFFNAGLKTGLNAERADIRPLLGLPHLEIVKKLWANKLGTDDPNYDQSVANTFHLFTAILQNHYVLNGAKPMKGAMDTFKWLRAEGVYIALTTGTSRKIAKIILDKLGWSEGLDENFRGSEISIIDLSLTPDEAGGKGNPFPDMVQKAMELLEIDKSSQVIRVGDTIHDLQSGKRANCLLSIGVTNGAGTPEELSGADSDLIIDHIGELRDAVSAQLAGA